eukprot:TRINITY_DN980_c0_g1_i2.p1 TRINITY_DN980_c0_g1~~TRINITY_DN980_c0_g1_i2.p1  ORF type:complete len:1235 (+),score=218.82 TRINITY_DN980_c0_g1_i2:393-4097(+)
MGGGSPSHAPEKEVASAIAGTSVVDSPILLLVCFHKALRAELANLHRLANILLPSSSTTERPSRSSVLDLCQRYRFLHKIYKYHCAGEDEVVFHALDKHVRNVACTYSLEHSSISDLFDSLFYWLDVLLNDDGPSSKPCHELAHLTGTIQTSICRHMLKEEKQVFPLLMQRLSFKEQASLVWQFICSVPVILLEDFLPWMMSYLSVREHADAIFCIKEIIPKERLLQEVVISWLGKKSLSFSGAYTSRKDEKVALGLDEPSNLEELPKIYSSREFLSHEKSRQKESDHLHSTASNCPINNLRLWHGIIMKELKEILAEIHDMRNFRNILSLSSASSRIMFIADVLIFYSDALEKVIFPVLNKHVDGELCFSHQQFPEESQIEGLLCVLQSFNALNKKPFSKLVEKLCWQLESFITGINKHLAFQESEVFPLICKNCDNEMQQRCLYESILMMPLGLLKSVITWLSANLTDDESKAVLCSIKLAGPAVNTAFAALLYDWFSIGYSGKTSLEIFHKELQEMFKSRSSFIPEQIDEGTGFYLDMKMRPFKRPHPSEAKASSADKDKDMKSLTSALPGTCSVTTDSSHVMSQDTDECSTSYSSEINLQIFFSKALKKISSFSQLLADELDAGTNVQEPKPIDHIFHFHKALEKDLEYLVTVSASMVEELDALKEFRQRFLIVQVLYQAHSTAEDEIAFPALEAKGTLQNISGSYTIDHKLEEEHFQNVANVLDEISELHSFLSTAMISTVGAAALDQRMLMYQDMCMKLHGMCKSMQTTLGHHVHREESELWPLFLEHFSEEEQEKIIGSIIGRTRAEILQTMIPWLMASLSPSEQNTMMSSWRKATKNTMFNEWLSEWWEGMKRNDISMVIEEQSIPPSGATDSLEVVAAYLSKDGSSVPKRVSLHDTRSGLLRWNSTGITTILSGDANGDDQKLSRNREKQQFSERMKLHSGTDIHKTVDVNDTAEKPMQIAPISQNFTPLQEHLLTMSQEDLEASIRKVSHDPTLEPDQKSYLIQNLLMSRWMISQQVLHSEETIFSDGAEVPGLSVSFRDPLKLTFGCKHYKRNCKLLFSCCNKLFTCKYCHDDVSDHLMDRKLTTKMMCMKCLQIQPIGRKCSNINCNDLSMARYFCCICKLFDDEREIYHCPFCNLCRVGKGLGIDYFHCMNCNACMSKSLAVHICLEKCFESNCPICHDDIFTSSSPVKALPCGHLMHSTCFQQVIGRHAGVLWDAGCTVG